MRLLLLSNSTNYGENFLDYAIDEIASFLTDINENIVFIPFAAVSFSYDEYEKKVQNKFLQIDKKISSIHRFEDKQTVINEAKAIIVGGGNTFHLLHELQRLNLIESISKKVKGNESAFVGWSAGSNIVSPTICTTNDMPIIEPQSFKSLNLVPFQINPHFTDATLPNHGGETRSDRITEYIAINDNFVVGLPEGCLLKFYKNKLSFVGQKNLKIFKKSIEPLELRSPDNFDFLMR